MKQREKQTEWLADLIEEHYDGLGINILGKSFRREGNITTGSPSILLKTKIPVNLSGEEYLCGT